MPEKILVIDNSTFFVTCHIGEEPQDVQDVQWFLVGDSQNLLADQTCQSVILDQYRYWRRSLYRQPSVC